ncbi:MAG TPA: DMT family transporter [Sphingomicrobium sp.]|nr:DMT family transporter [Sphingomicrobium sp.]
MSKGIFICGRKPATDASSLASGMRYASCRAIAGSDFALWCLLAALWGSSFLAIGIGVRTLGIFELVTGRTVIGAALLIAVVVAVDGSLRLTPRGWLLAAIVGLTGNVIPFLLISFAEQHVDTGLAALIMGLAPIATLSLAPLVHPDETLTSGKMIGGALGLGGLTLLVGPDAFGGLGSNLIAQVALVLAALCYAATALISRRFAYPEPLQMAAASVLVAALTTGAMCLSGGDNPGLHSPSLGSLLAVVYLGIGPTALAAIIYFRLIPRIGATALQQVNYVVPVLGTVLGILFLRERPTWNAMLAIPVVLLAIRLVTRSVHRG